MKLLLLPLAIPALYQARVFKKASECIEEAEESEAYCKKCKKALYFNAQSKKRLGYINRSFLTIRRSSDRVRAYLSCFLNLAIPGLGTLLNQIFAGRGEFTWWGIIIAILQFILWKVSKFGYLWSLVWGVEMIRLYYHDHRQP